MNNYTIDFVERMIVDCNELITLRNHFLKGGEVTEEHLYRVKEITPSLQADGAWGKNTLTLVSWPGITNVRYCLERVIQDGIEGDFIETGVWRGGICILAKYIINYFNSDKKVFVADSFEGLPKPNADLYPMDSGDKHYKLDYLKVSLETVVENFKKFNLLDDRIIFLKGWFKDTLPNAPIDKLSVLRLDGDMHESTIQALDSLYPKLSEGGYCIIDDYGLRGCNYAVNKYRELHNIQNPIIFEPDIDPNLAFWRKI